MSLMLLFAGTSSSPTVTASVNVGRQMGIRGGIGGVVSWIKVVRPVG